jgi:solute carrier family 25 phosphate transporter 3
MAKFVVFEQLSEMVYNSMSTPKDQLSNSSVVAVNLSSGVGAGVCAAIISQPADTMLSKINKAGAGGSGGTVSRLFNIASELGMRGLFLGLGARCVMVGTLTAGQFAIYGDIKRILNATGGTDIAKVVTAK